MCSIVKNAMQRSGHLIRIREKCAQMRSKSGYVSGHVSDYDNSQQRKLMLIRKSGFESETEQIRSSLSELSESGNEWGEWETSRDTPRGQLSNAMPLRAHKLRSTINRDNVFVDFRRVLFAGGDGGDGMISFLRLWCNPNGGPSGGDGGNGGHILLEANKEVKSLKNVNAAYSAKAGEKGMSKDMFGGSGDHTVVKVPVGTLIRHPITGRVIADLNIDGSKFIAARGGAGGKGNHYFLSNNNRHPKVAELGAKGERNIWILEMKTMAHAGLVGFPNAGKSTLLRAISRAKPKVASYPFTTLNPHIGIIQYDDFEQLAVADLPGLIPGSHLNKGLGIQFLRHIERCVCLFYVIDISMENPWQQLESLMFELEQYRTGLSKRPHAIVANKCDVNNSQANLEALRQHLGEHNFKIIPISAKYGNNVTELLTYFRELYDLYNYDEDDQKHLVW